MTTLALVPVACATQGVFKCGTWDFPRLPGIVCDAASHTAVVRVTVVDEAGEALPGALVQLLTDRAGAPALVTAQTDMSGLATLEDTPEQPRVRVLVVVLPGFSPELHQALLEPGCSGNVNFVLRVASGPK